MSNLYVNKPGGVIAKRADGTAESYKYGDPVSADMFADHVDVNSFADSRPRVAVESQELDAHRRAALTENGQVNSSSSPVPGNYSELEEDAAAQLMSNLARFPEMQAAILKHEVLFGGNRQKVLDAASDSAKVSIALQLSALPEAASVTGDVTGAPVAPMGDPDMGGFARDDVEAAKRMQAQHAAQLRTQTPPPMAQQDDDGEDISALRERLAAAESALSASAQRTNTGESNMGEGAEAVTWDKFTADDLKSYIDQHELPVAKSQNKDDLLEDIQNVEGHEDPQTPPASKS